MAIPAFGLKYKVPYTNYYGANREIRIYKDGYSAIPIELKGGRAPFTLEKGNTDDLFGNLIVSGVASIELLLEYQLDITEFLEERQSHLVHWYDLDNDKILWSGWIEPYDGNKPYSKAPHYVTLKASCGLSQLKKIRFQHNPAEDPRKVALSIIRNILFQTGLSLNINTSVFTLEVSMPADSDPLANYRINTNRYFTSGKRIYSYEALADIMEKHNCEIFQENNEWIIRSLPDQARGYMSQRNYLPGGAFNTVRELNLNYVINSDTYHINNGRALSLATGTIKALRPIKKWTAFAELAPFTNPIANGDLTGWNGTTFPGWNLDHMTGRWEKISTADPIYPNALQINGVVYAPDIFKFKTNFWGKKINKWREPSLFIDAPILPFDIFASTTTVSIMYRLEGPFDRLKDMSAFVTVWTERANNTDRKYLQQDGSWNKEWGCVGFNGGTSDLDRNPVEMKLVLKTKELNSTTQFKPFEIPNRYEVLHVRIYPALVPNARNDDNTIKLKIFSVGTIGTETGKDMPTTVSYSLSTESLVEDEVSPVNLMTAELGGTFLTGIMLRLNQNANTSPWSRKGFDERKTILGVMITDRIAMTALPSGVVQCDIKVLHGTPAAMFQYQNYLIFTDIHPTQRWKILRYRLNDLTGVVTVTAVEFNHADAQNVTGETQLGDGTISYDNTGDSSVSEPIEVPVADGIISPEDIYDNARISFELLPEVIFVAGVPEIKVVNIVDFLYPDEDEDEIPDLTGFNIIIFSKPSFINSIEIEGLTLTIDASPKVSGQFSIPYQISDPESGEIVTGHIVVIVEPNEDIIEDWPPVLDPFPVLYFEIGKESTTGFLITDYMPDQVYEKLTYRIMGKPDWVITQSVVFNELSVTAKPTRIETRYIILEMKDALGNVHTEQLTLTVIPKTVNKHSVFDTSAADAVNIGKIPGFYYQPEKWGVQSIVAGLHDGYEWTIVGGGIGGTEINLSGVEDVEPTDTATYGPFPLPGGVVSSAGQFRYTFKTLRAGSVVSDEIVDFTLYDEAFLEKASFELWDTEKDELLGVIAPDGTSVFKKVKSFDVKVILSGFEFDNTDLPLTKDGVEVFANTFPENPAVEEAQYDLFGEVTDDYGSGKYGINMTNTLAGDLVYSRSITWEILGEEVKPKAGFDLITFNQSTVNYTLIDNLPLINYQADLPENWGLSLPPVEVEYNNVDFKVFETTDGALVNFNIALRTNTPQSRTYLEGQEKEPILIFGLKDSVELGIHGAPRSFRAVAYFRDGETVVDIRQADFSFREPIGPEGYSGIRLITNDDSFNVTVIDPNVPKVGRKFALPELPFRYSLSVREIDGLLFDQIKVKYKKKVAGDYVTLFWLGSDYIKQYTSSTDISELDSDLQANVIGILNPEGLRYLYATGFAEYIIDEKGEYLAEFIFYLDGAEVGIKSAEIEITDGDPEELPIEDCCGGGSEIPEYENLAGEYGGPGKTLIASVTNIGTVSEIEEVDIELPGVDFTGDEWDFDKPPKILSQGTALNDAVTYGQLLEVAANGTADKLAVKTVATSNIALSGLQTINGYTTLSGDRVLAQNQTNPSENGPYVASAGGWTRAADSDTSSELLAAAYLVEAGNASVIGTKWKVVTPGTITVGTTPISIIKIQNALADTRWNSLPVVGNAISNFRNGGVGTWYGEAADSAYPLGTVLSVVGNSADGNGAASGTWINHIRFGNNGEVNWAQSLYGWNAWGPNYQFWTTKHFSPADISSWATAFSWGNHASAGYMFAANFNSKFDERFNLKTTNDLREGVNGLYFNEQRVRDTLLTGIGNGSNSPISAGNNLLQALANLQAQISTVGSNRYVSLNPNNGFASDDLATLDYNAINKTSAGHAVNVVNGPFSNYGFVNTIAVGPFAFFQTAFSQLDEDSFFYRGKSSGNVMPWFRVVSRTYADVTYLRLDNYLTYFNASFNTAFAGKSTDALPEGQTYKYFSEQRVRDTPLTGLADGPNTNILASDSVLSAFGKIKTQLTNRVPLTRQIIAGTGLTGGGDLSVDRTFAFDTAFGDARYLTPGSSRFVSLNPANGFASDDVANYDANAINKTSAGHVTNLLNSPGGSYWFVDTIALGAFAFFQTAFSQLDPDSFHYRSKSSGNVTPWMQVASRAWSNSVYLKMADFNSYFNTAFGNKSTSDLEEGSKLYFTQARVLSTVLNGYAVGANSAILASDTILSAFGKTQGQLNAINATLSNVAGAVSGTPGYLPVFSASNALGNSMASQAGGILSIAGQIRSTGNYIDIAASPIGTTGFYFRTGGIIKWGVGVIGSETGGNAGSDYWIYSVTDVGGFGRDVMRLNRSTALATFYGNVIGADPSAGNHLTTKSYVDGLIATKENSFAKGSIIQGARISITGNLSNRLVGTGDLTINVAGLGIGDIADLPGQLNGKASISTTNDLQNQINGKSELNHTHALSAITGASDINAIEILTGTGFLKRTGDNIWLLSGIGIGDVNDLAGQLNGKASVSTTNDLQNQLNGKAPLSHTHPLSQITGADDLAAIESLSGTGFLKRFGTNNWFTVGIGIGDVVDLAGQLNGKADFNHTHALSAITGAGDVNAIENLTGSGVLKRLGDSNWTLSGISIGDVSDLTGQLNGKASTATTNDLQNQINGRATISTTNDLQNQINGKIGTDKYIIINGQLQYINNNPNFTVSAGGSGNISGGGDESYVPRYNGSGTNLGNSRIYDPLGSSDIKMFANVQIQGALNVTSNISALNVNSTAGSFSTLYVNNIFKLPTMSQASMEAMSNPEIGRIVFVNSGGGLGLWAYFGGSAGWRIFATRLYIGGVFGGSNAP